MDPIKMTTQFFTVPRNIVNSKEFKSQSKSAQLLYICLCDNSNKFNNYNDKIDESFYKSLNDLCKEVSMIKNTIILCIKELEKNGFISVERSKFTPLIGARPFCNRYKINGFSFKNNNKNSNNSALYS